MVFLLLFLQKKQKSTLQKKLNLVFGVGLFQLKKMCFKFGLKPALLWEILNNKKKNSLWDFLFHDSSQLKDERLKFFYRENLQKKLKVRNNKFLRLFHGLPVRGQNTKNNAKTAKKLNKMQLEK